MKNDLPDRLFELDTGVLNLLKTFPDTPEGKVIRYQLAKAATSAGANYEESQAGSSKADFANKIRISLREMKETNYWLRLLKVSISEKLLDQELLNQLLQEFDELRKILAAILNKC